MPGPGGINAARAVMNAPPDGYTMALVTNGTSISVAAFNKLPFDPVKDFAMVSMVGTFDLVFAVDANSEYKTLGDFIKAAKANPGKLNVGTIAARRHAKSRRRIVQVDGRTSTCRSCRTRTRRTSWWRCCATTCR